MSLIRAYAHVGGFKLLLAEKRIHIFERDSDIACAVLRTTTPDTVATFAEIITNHLYIFLDHSIQELEESSRLILPLPHIIESGIDTMAFRLAYNYTVFTRRNNGIIEKMY